MNYANLFLTVPDDVLGFGRGKKFSAKHVVEWLNLKKDDVARIADVSPKSVRYDEAIPQAVIDRVEEIANVCNMVAQIFNGDAAKAALWFKAKNPLLGDISPRDMVRLGRYDRLRKFIFNAVADNQVPRTNARASADA